MSTSNFHYENSSKIFAVKLLSYDEVYSDDEDVNTDENPAEGWEYDDLQEVLTDELEELAQKNKGIGFWSKHGEDKDELRSYPSYVIGTLFKDRSFKDFDIRVNVIAVIRSAYYDGCNLDWSFEFDIANTSTDELDFVNELEYVLDSRKMAEYKAKIAEKWAEKTLNELTEKLEAVYQNICTQTLGVTAIFSNGEAVYHVVK